MEFHSKVLKAKTFRAFRFTKKPAAFFEKPPGRFGRYLVSSTKLLERISASSGTSSSMAQR